MMTNRIEIIKIYCKIDLKFSLAKLNRHFLRRHVGLQRSRLPTSGSLARCLRWPLLCGLSYTLWLKKINKVRKETGSERIELMQMLIFTCQYAGPNLKFSQFVLK